MRLIDDKFIDVKKQTIFLLISLAVSYFSTFVTSDWDPSAQYIFATLIFAILVLLDILFVIAVGAANHIQEFQLWKVREKGDELLLNIRNDFFQIVERSRGERDLFVSHFEREFIRLEQAICEVAENGELRVSSHHYVDVDTVLNTFVGESDPVYRATWGLASGEKLFPDLASRRYFELVCNLINQGVIREIRVVFVIDDTDVLDYPRVAKFLDFFKTNSGCSCCLIKNADYRGLCQDNDVGLQYSDIGIFGTRLLFLTEQYEPSIVGVFTKDENRINHLRKHFDSIWQSSAVTTANPSTATKQLSVADLFKLDEEPI